MHQVIEGAYDFPVSIEIFEKHSLLISNNCTSLHVLRWSKYSSCWINNAYLYLEHLTLLILAFHAEILIVRSGLTFLFTFHTTLNRNSTITQVLGSGLCLFLILFQSDYWHWRLFAYILKNKHYHKIYGVLVEIGLKSGERIG